jgi:membrane-bound serine protease (ClpP class)
MLPCLLWGSGTVAESGDTALLIDVAGAIGPAALSYVEDAIDQAEAQGAELLVLRMDTPGGLDTSMRAIVKAITGSPVPVVGYVAPTGARAASAGTYILYACHVAAMAPGTNLGAATPVQLIGSAALDGAKERRGQSAVLMRTLLAADAADPSNPAAGSSGSDPLPASTAGSDGDAKNRKLVNDAAAYLRGLAKLRGRNAEWAEQAVREGASLSAEEALALNVIDLIASDVESLLKAIDGRVVRIGDDERRLTSAELVVVRQQPNWKTRLLAIISDPNVAYILLLVGIYGLVYEFSNPGAVLPGTVGAVSLLLALYAFQLLPINYAGMALIILGLALMIAEAFAPSFGALGLGGAAAFIVGSFILIDTEAPGFGLSIPLIVGFAIGSALLLFFVVGMALRAYRRPVSSGSEEMIGAEGEAVDGFPGDGSIHVHGEIWTARSPAAIPPHARVRVIGRDGLSLVVEPLAAATDQTVSNIR